MSYHNITSSEREDYQFGRTLSYLQRSEYTLNTKLEIIWSAYQYITFIFPFALTIVRVYFLSSNFKLYYSEAEAKAGFPELKKYRTIDYIARIYFTFISLNYIVDLVLLLYKLATNFEDFSTCFVVLFFHHLITVACIPQFLNVEFYPPIIMIPWGLHAMLMMFTEGFLGTMFEILYFGIAFVLLCELALLPV